MSALKKPARIFIITTLASCVLGILYSVVSSQNQHTSDFPAFPFQREKSRILKLIQTKDLLEAYRYARRAYGRYYAIDVHDFFHWIGSIIYEKEGIDGISICDDSYNWGCFHGFLGSALPKEGEELLAKLEPICASKLTKSGVPNGCLHGIGHGLLSLEGGYEYQHLVKALGDCDVLRSSQSQGACYNGVFMEYNMRTMLGVDKTSTIRSIEGDNLLAPCDELQERYQQDCYYEQADWWRLVLDKDFLLIGKLCTNISYDKAREGCFRGVGRGIWGESRFTPAIAQDYCQRMSSKEGIVFCLGAIRGDKQPLR